MPGCMMSNKMRLWRVCRNGGTCMHACSLLNLLRTYQLQLSWCFSATVPPAAIHAEVLQMAVLLKAWHFVVFHTTVLSPSIHPPQVSATCGTLNLTAARDRGVTSLQPLWQLDRAHVKFRSTRGLAAPSSYTKAVQTPSGMLRTHHVGLGNASKWWLPTTRPQFPTSKVTRIASCQRQETSHWTPWVGLAAGCMRRRGITL